VTFEKFCATQQYLQTQQNLMAKEILERELQRRLTKESNHALQEIAVKTRTQLRFYRSSLMGMAKALSDYNEESLKELKAIESVNYWTDGKMPESARHSPSKC